MDKLLLRPAEVAELLGIGRSKAYELIAGGSIPAVRLGASVRVPADSLRVWIAARTDDEARAALTANVDRTSRK